MTTRNRIANAGMPKSRKLSIHLPLPLLYIIVASLFVGCASREDRIEDALAKSDAFMLSNKAGEAIAILEKTLARYPDSAPLQESLGTAHLVNGNNELSIQAYRKTIELDLERSSLWKKIADQEARLGQDDSAIRSYESYLAYNPNDFIAWKNVAELQEKNGRYSQAIKAAQEWQNLKPSARPSYQLGRLFYLSGNFAVARMWYTESARHQKEKTAQEALAALIELETNVQQYIEAERLLPEYEKRYGRTSSNPRIQAAKSSIALWRQRQTEIAEQAQKLEEERQELERQKLEAEKREDDARQRRLSLAALEDAPPVGGESNGSAEVEDAPKLYPDEETDLNSGNALTQDPEPIAQVTPASDQLLIEAQKSFDSGDYGTAIDLYWTALGSNAENANVWHQLALAYSQQNQWIDAQNCALEARRRASSSASIAGTYLRIISNTQSLNNLISEAQTLRDLFPANSQIALATAQAFLNANASPNDVAQAYRDFIRLADENAPGYQEAQSYLSR